MYQHMLAVVAQHYNPLSIIYYMKLLNTELDGFTKRLMTKAIRSGDIFSANERSKNSFYYSYNVTLKELSQNLTLEELILNEKI